MATRLQSDADPNGTVTWLHSDHLNSASVATDANGNKVAGSDTRYMPFGEQRTGFVGAGLPTDRRFGGHVNVGSGLVDMNARFYLPGLGRFVSADTVVPGAGSPQGFNRYSFVLNKPMILVDPTGHCGTKPEDSDVFCLPTLKQQKENKKLVGHLVMM